MDAEITVLIPVRNGENFIREAIDSVLEQTFTRWNLLVRNNCSTDRTQPIVESYLGDKRIHLVNGQTSVSMLGNFNECLALVQTPYYMLLCHDDYLYAPDGLQAAYDVMQKQPSLPTVYSDLMYVDKDRRNLLHRHFHRSGLVDSKPLARSSILQMRNLFGIPLLARTAALSGRSYDETLPYLADLELAIATANRGPVYHIPRPLIANRYHDRNSTGSLMHDVFNQMKAMANRHQIPLSTTDFIRMRIAAQSTSVTKSAFLLYARILHYAPRSGRLSGLASPH